MAATPQNTPNFTGGGNVFARLASQWNQYFGAKVDAEGGTADNLTVTGTLNVTTATIVGWLSLIFKSLTVNSNTAQLPTAETGTIVQLGNQDGIATRIEADAFGAPSFVTVQRSDGTNAAPTTLVNGDEIGAFNAWGYNGSAYVGPQASVRLLARGTWTGSSAPTEIRFSTTPSGSLTMTDRWHIGAAGGLYADGVIGADEGVGTVNATNLYVAGVPVITGNQNITLSGDVTGSGVTAIATTLSTVNGSVGTFGGTGAIPVVTVNGKGLVTAITTAAVKQLVISEQVFLSSGTYTPSAGLVYAIIDCVGGGGAGGGAAASATGISSGGGGGAGGRSTTIASAAVIGVSQTVTIGAGGTGVNNANGNAGGDTSVGSICIAKGGSGGGVAATNSVGGGGAGGVSGTGTITYPGNPGNTSLGATVTTIILPSGNGGQGPFGGLGGGAIGSSGNSAPNNSGGGGGGGQSDGTASTAAGGNGGSGAAYIMEFCFR